MTVLWKLNRLDCVKEYLGGRHLVWVTGVQPLPLKGFQWSDFERERQLGRPPHKTTSPLRSTVQKLPSWFYQDHHKSLLTKPFLNCFSTIS